MTIFKIFCVLFLTLTGISTLPIDRTLQNEAKVEIVNEVGGEILTEEENATKNALNNNVTRNLNNLVRMPDGFRPEMQVNRYEVEISPNINDGSFNGILRAQVSITDQDARDQDLRFFVEGLEVNSVKFALGGSSTFTDAAGFGINGDDGTLDINTDVEGTSYNLIIQYTGSLTTVGQGLYTGSYRGDNYLAMNLYAQNARRVFPSVDMPNQPSFISFEFRDVDSFGNMIMNSAPVENEDSSFMPLRGPPLLWTMTAHSFNSINMPTTNVHLFARSGVSNQESQASVAINNFFNKLNEWTNLNYFDIIPNQNPQLHIVALPDISRNWYGLSTIGIWEPYVLMENVCSVKQRFTALSKIGESLARQWYGYALYPQNFRFHWVLSGLASYAGFDVLREFQTVPPNIDDDISMLDINTLFVTEIIQESLLRDGYIAATVMETPDNIFNQDEVREHINGILNYKAPAILRMLRLVLGGADNDFIQVAARSMIAGRQADQPQPINMLSFVDAILGDYSHNGNGFIENIEEYLNPFVRNNGYPLLVVRWQQGGVSITLERFNYYRTLPSDYNIPITYSISNAANYQNIYPVFMSDNVPNIPMLLDDDDYVLFNVQGQGYYRVSYDNILWERILEALQDPDRRAEIHPLNRATLLDDALNLARGGRLDIETALDVVLTWEHETEYAPWKAFVRNMDFLRKRLVAMVTEDEDLDPDIYLRMVRRTIGTFENEIGFIPDPQATEPAMTLLTRGLVMDHACRAGYQPCIAAALDVFYNDDVVNPDIPKDIRPAVYCTAVREWDMDAIEALQARFEIEPSMWERVVILESLACSTNRDYINELLEETISNDVPYTTEERSRIFIAVAESSYQNAQAALEFLRMRDNQIREWYGGDEKLELIINALAENVVDGGFVERFHNYVTSSLNNLNDAQHSANRANEIAAENLEWERRRMRAVYNWIDENDAPRLMLSFTLIILSFAVALINR